MCKKVCCCFCIRRKSKVTVAPNSNGVTNADSRSGRLLVQTAPGRFVSLTVLTNGNADASRTASASNSRRQRNGRTSTSASKKRNEKPEGSTSEVEESKMVHDIEPESDSVDQEKGNTVVVIVDVERPKTGDTISSRISLPPLRSASPVVAGTKIRKLKWNLRRRVASETRAADTPRLPKSVSASSISTTILGADSEDAPALKEKQKASKNHHVVASSAVQDSWADEIVTLPGTADADQAPDLGSVRGVDNQHFGADGAANMVLFFIHGVGGNSSIWANQIKHFRELGYNIVAIDLIGHGYSNAPGAKSAYTFDAIKSDMLSIFDRFARDKNVIIAHSYGTCFAAVLARERREKVSHLVLLSSGAPVPLDADDGAFALPTPILALLRPALSRTFMKLAFTSTPSADHFKASFGAVRTGVLKRVMQGQRWSDCTYLYHQQIHAPTLLIYGSVDGLVSLDEMHEMRKAIPGSVLEVVDQAAHMVMLEQPAQVNRLIQTFLRSAPCDQEDETEEAADEKAEVDHEFYADKRRMTRPTTATSRTIPPSNVFKIHGHDSLVNVNMRTVAVS